MSMPWAWTSLNNQYGYNILEIPVIFKSLKRYSMIIYIQFDNTEFEYRRQQHRSRKFDKRSRDKVAIE